MKGERENCDGAEVGAEGMTTPEKLPAKRLTKPEEKELRVN